jgi:hypothetical protein
MDPEERSSSILYKIFFLKKYIFEANAFIYHLFHIQCSSIYLHRGMYIIMHIYSLLHNIIAIFSITKPELVSCVPEADAMRCRCACHRFFVRLVICMYVCMYIFHWLHRNLLYVSNM